MGCVGKDAQGGRALLGKQHTAETIGWSAETRTKRRAVTSCTPLEERFSDVLRTHIHESVSVRCRNRGVLGLQTGCDL